MNNVRRGHGSQRKLLVEERRIIISLGWRNVSRPSALKLEHECNSRTLARAYRHTCETRIHEVKHRETAAWPRFRSMHASQASFKGPRLNLTWLNIIILRGACE